MNAQKKLQRHIAKVDKFNAELQKYIAETGSNELPEIGSTVIGYSELDKYEVTKVSDTEYIINADGIEINLAVVVEDGEEYITGWDGYDGLKESIAYDMRRLNKGWKVWRSDNPDAELEKDDDE